MNERSYNNIKCHKSLYTPFDEECIGMYDLSVYK
nr:MAG TPA: hypothetical protein [Caudoviricetes sp.]